MSWDQSTYYRALSARDPRFDGVFFVGVTSTRVYCRPICPARTPLQKNCTFHLSPAAAARAGFRPCLRCRPELAPGRAPVDAVSRLAQVVAQRVEGDSSLAELAQDLGVSDRQLRRAVQREFGVSPSALRTHRRLELAHRLLVETELQVTEVAFASGFGSLRRFHAAFKEHFGDPPKRLKRRASRQQSSVLQLSYREPLDWEALLAFLKPRLWAGVEAISGLSYRRTVRIGKREGEIEVKPLRKGRLQVSVPVSLTPCAGKILAAVRKLFDLDCDPLEIASQLCPSLPTFQTGLRVPGAFDNFELAVRALLGQQISVKGATTIGGRLVQAFGRPRQEPSQELAYLFPTPRTLADSSPEKLKSIGLTTARAKSLKALATAVAQGTLRLTPGLEMGAQLQELERIPGIGPWTAHYIAMRALGWPDAFPHQDLGLRKAHNNCSANELLELSQAWRPWRAYAAQHLWRTL